MAILQRLLEHSQQRFDLEDLNTILSALRSDSKYWQLLFNAQTSYVVAGFEISSSSIGQSSINIVLDSSILLNPNNSTDFSWFAGFSGASPINVGIEAGALVIGRNYVELQLSTIDSVPLQRAFWDPTANSGAGGEFQQQVNTTTELQVQVVVNQTAFHVSNPDLIPLAIVDVNSSALISGILDQRNLFFRLGTKDTPTLGWTWNTQIEPPTTLTFVMNSSPAFDAGETITFTSGATAVLETGGTNNIQATSFSGLNFALGDTVTGLTSGATGTLQSFYESFVGADKDILNLKEMLNALMTEIRTLKGTPYWYSQSVAPTTPGLLDFINTIPVPLTAGAKYEWDGSNLAISDAATSGQSSADQIAALRIPGKSGTFILSRQDGTVSTSEIAIGDGQILFIILPSDLTTSRTYSGIGTASTNFQVIARNSFVATDKTHWLAYREGSRLITHGFGQMVAGQEMSIDAGGGGGGGGVQEFIPFRLYENVPNTSVLNIGPSVNTDDVSGKKSAVSRNPPNTSDFLGGTISFPTTSGNNATPSVGSAVRIDIQSSFYLKVLIAVDLSGNIVIVPGVQASSLSAAKLPAFPYGAFSIGYIVLVNTAGVISLISQTNIYQFADLGHFEDGNNGGGNVYKEDVDVVSSPSGNDQMAPISSPPVTVTIPKDTNLYLGTGLEARVTSSSSTVQVSKSNHGLTTGDLVTIITASAIGGITGGNLSQTATACTVIDSNNFSYVAGAAGTYNDYGTLDATFANTTRHFIVGDRTLVVYLNGVEQRNGIDYSEFGTFGLSSNQIIWLTTIVVGDLVTYEIVRVGGLTILQNGSPVATGTLQESYNNGQSIVTESGAPVVISGPSGQKLLHVAGNVQIDGVIDPTAITFTPQSSNPLSSGQQGIWFDSSNAMHTYDGTTDTNTNASFVKINGSNPFTGPQSMGSNKLTNVATPTVSSDAATKGYVDGLAISALIGDVSGTGPGSTSTTVNSVGGSSASNIHSAEQAANAATIFPTASTISKWDAHINLSANSFLSGYATTTSSLTPLVLTVSSAYRQYITGSVAQTVTLPIVSTLTIGQEFEIVNLASTSITVESSGLNTVQTMAANTVARFTAILTTGTTAASWAVKYGYLSGGSVNSVALFDASTIPIYGVSGSPITAAGTLDLTLVNQSANQVFAGPTSGGVTQPAFRALVATDIPSLSSTYVTQAEVGAVSGVAPLDVSGKIPIGYLPSSVFEYQGAWNPTTNTPTLVDGTGQSGYTYWISAAFAGPISGLNNSSMINFQIGDLVIYNGSQWELTTPAAGVTSVNGAQGAVTVNAISQLTGDVTAGPASGSASAAASVAKIQGTVVSGTTGSGNVVFSASPVLTTPTITIKDNALTLENSTDTTKQALFSLVGITTGHTTTLAVPEVNGTDTLGLIALAQSPTNKTFDATSFFPTISEQMIAGQSFSANTIYAVRLGQGGQSETVGRIYAADPSVSGGVNNYFAIGLIYPTGAISAGGSVNVVKMGLINVGASTYTSGQTGTPLYLTTSGAVTLTNPGATDVLTIRVGIVRDTAKIEVQILGWY
jgi:hypothetical protein